MNTINIEEGDLLDKEIDYYKINESHFEELYNVEFLNDIELDNEGYVSNSILSKFSSDELIDKEFTCMINAGVGQGKSTSVINLSNYFITKGYKVIIASPLLSIVEDYYKIYIDKYPQERDNVFTLDILMNVDLIDKDGYSRIDEYAKRSLHIVTTNLLLRNPGDFYQQKKEKTEYLESLISSSEDKKVVVFFDEIHASVQNFTFERIIKYSKFRDKISKQFVLSATFNLASVLVTKYISGFTNFNIIAANIERKKFSNKQNDLHLYFHDSNYSDIHPNNFFDLLSEIISVSINNNESTFILSFSSSLCDKIVENSKIASLLISKNIRPKICTSTKGLKPHSNDKFIVGTNFNTGKSLKNGRYIIVLPNKALFNSKNNDLSSLGIFADGGADTFIQSLARMRSGGTIHIIMSTPKYLLGQENKEKLEPYNEFLNLGDLEIIHSQKYNDQDNDIFTFYDEMKGEFISEIDAINELRNNRQYPYIKYPSLEEFILTEGRKYVDIRNKYFGREITPFILKSAFENQFENCTLKSINSLIKNKNIININELTEVFNSEFDITKNSDILPEGYNNDAHLHTAFMCDLDAFYFLLNETSSFRIKIEGKKVPKSLLSYNHRLLKILYNYKCNLDIEYTEDLFFNHQMYVCNNFDSYLIVVDEEKYITNEIDKNIIQYFKRIYQISNKFTLLIGADNIIEKSIEGTKYYDFFLPLQNEISEMSNFLNSNVYLLKKRIFNFIRNPNENSISSLDTIFKAFKKINLVIDKTKVTKVVDGKNVNFDKIISIIKDPNSIEDCLNLSFTYPVKGANIDLEILKNYGFETIAEL